MAVERAYEAGNFGALISLGGIKGNRGRIIETNDPSLTATVLLTVLSDNPKRISAILHNPSAVDIDISFIPGSGTGGYIRLRPYDALQLDSNFPWTGQVGAISWVAGAVLHVLEISVL